MAIDTAAKRKNISSIGLPHMGPGVTPDATPDSFWHYAVAYSYAGFVLLYTQYYYITEAFDPAEYPTGGVFKLVAVLMATTGYTTTARLYNVTDAVEIGTVSTSATSPTNVESGALTMPASAKTLRVEFGTFNGGVARCFSVRVRFDPP